MRLLIADDDADSQRILELILANDGFEVLKAADGEEALQYLLHEDPPDLALIDWMMPKLSGVEVCRKARQLSAATSTYTYIIILTARTREDDLIEGLEAGADDYIIKPYNTKELRLRIRAGQRVVGLHKQLREYAFFVNDLNYALAHDMKTPLLSLKLTSSQALDGAWGEMPASYIDVLKKSCNAIDLVLRLTDSIRAMSQFEASNMESTMEAVDLKSLASRCLMELEPLFKQKALDYELICAEDSIDFTCNSQDLTRLINNLIDNAIKFSPLDSTITLLLTKAAEGVSIGFFDEGPGIPLEDRAALFKRFSTRTGKKRGGGTGLGLFVSNRIALSLGGSIRYEDDGKRHGFVVELPHRLGLDTASGASECKQR
jgi:signal transduction histidine kinase